MWEFLKAFIFIDLAAIIIGGFAWMTYLLCEDDIVDFMHWYKTKQWFKLLFTSNLLLIMWSLIIGIVVMIWFTMYMPEALETATTTVTIVTG